jgi:hypothetical protein
MAGNDDGEAGNPAAARRKMPQVLLWVLLGILGGLLLAALFLAYGQPELLLEQLNLRYCG